MAAKVETLRISARPTPGWRAFLKAVAGAVRRWGQNGQLGSSDLEMRVYTGSR
jgi:hypothetical protein